MAIQIVDGFDLYNGSGSNTGLLSKWIVNSPGNFSASMTTGRFGGQAVRMAVGTVTPMQRIFTASANISCGFGFRAVSWPTVAITGGLIYFGSDTTYMVGIDIPSNGSIVVSRHTAASTKTVLGTSSVGLITLNNFHYIEVELVISDTVGRVTVFVDGTQVLNLTNVDTRNGTPTTVNTVQLGQQTTNTNSGSFDFDDFYLTDTATRLGEMKVETLRPTSDVAQGFTRSTGSTNYTLVDETTANGDTDYVQASAVNTVDTYGLGDLSSTPASIAAVQLTAFAEKTDAGTRTIYLQAKSGATTSDGSAYTLAASYGKFDRILETDPNTSAAWTASGVNSLQGGPKVAS